MKLMFDHVIKLLSFRLILYCALFTTSIFTNKYILSTLKFTYPTVFQGWQTLVASFFLLIVKVCKKENTKYTVHGYGIIHLLPNLIFHVCSIVAGSKALSTIPVAIFLGVGNITNAAAYFASSSNSKFQLLSASLTAVTSVLLLVSHNKNVADLSNIWLISYVFFVIVDALYSDYITLKISRMKKLWYTNCFSVLILAPASLYLQEAFLALEFALTNKLKFFVSVIVSGISGGIAQVLSTSIDHNYSHSSAVSLSAVLSPFVFTEDVVTAAVFQILAINLISNTILCLPDKVTDRNSTDSTVV